MIIKSQNLGTVYRKDPCLNPILRTFCIIQLFDLAQPGGPKGLTQSPERGPLPGLKNETWEFGGLALNKT